VVNPPSGVADEKTSLAKDWHTNWRTIVIATGLLSLIILLQMHANPHLNLILFYGLPCALVALVVNTRWASLLAVVSAVVSEMIRYALAPDYNSTAVVLWNFATRLVVLEALVLILGRIRYDFAHNGDQVD